ncbi:hypothetical protein CesoFtcFv8_005553 [Champsocephalus esox]|uniref:Uncharacterized protein n=1 Tax=Champsocephalus esox TaxID=159716 RepID=A0AAN8CPX4_9TELE|nr:hypothetical protein CesoFtcFv8_005553 [Champsocephalus esox]
MEQRARLTAAAGARYRRKGPERGRKGEEKRGITNDGAKPGRRGLAGRCRLSLRPQLKNLLCRQKCFSVVAL